MTDPPRDNDEPPRAPNGPNDEAAPPSESTHGSELVGSVDFQQAISDSAQTHPDGWWGLVFDPNDLDHVDNRAAHDDAHDNPIVVRLSDEPPPQPRILVLGWCIWLLGSWLATMSGEMSIAAVRRMIFASMVGMVAVWPAFRLSQPPPNLRWNKNVSVPDDRRWRRERLRIATGVWLDWLCLYAVFQLVIWSITIGVGWSAEQALWLDAAVGAWSLIAAGTVAWGAMGRSAPRPLIAMALCLGIMIGEPVLWFALGELSAGYWDIPPIGLSPIRMLWDMSQSAVSWTGPAYTEQLISVMVAGAILWAGVFAGAWLGPRPHTRQDKMPTESSSPGKPVADS